jgi:exodeoxyribonuclease VII small subunit
MEEKERLSFEQALSRLQDTVEELEKEDVSLERSVELYEKGMNLSKTCTELLENARLRIDKVNEQDDE